MNQAHLHLLFNHLPIFGSILGAFVLGYGFWKKSNHTIISAYYVFVVSAIGAGIAYLTGEPAEETVENIQGISKDMIEAHEEFGSAVLISFIALGVGSLLGILLTMRNSRLTRPLALVILFVSLVSFGLVARSGYLGGLIRHTEINSGTVIMEPAGENEDDD